MTTGSILNQVYSKFSNYLTTAAPKADQSQPIQRITFEIPEQTKNVYFMNSFDSVAAFDEQTKEIYVYDYKKGQLLHVFKCLSNVLKIQCRVRDLFVHMEGGLVQAWNVLSGKALKLKETWKKVDDLFFLKYYIVVVHPSDLKNSPLSLTLCDRDYQPIKKISTEFFKIHGMASKINNLYVTGLESNPINTEIPQSGFLMAYQDPDKNEIKRYKLNFELDSKVVNSNVLHIHSGLIYNSKWASKTSCVWDYNTLSTVLAKKAEKNIDENTLVEVLGYTIVIVDRKEVAVYDVIGELETEPPFFMSTRKELLLDQAYGTKQLSKVRTIECQKGDSIKCIHLFKISDEKVMAEGYESGKVVIRNLTTLNQMFEFLPPSNMKNVCLLKTNLYGDRLFVHYGAPSMDGTLGIVWNTSQQKPSAYIVREALKNRDYDSTQDTIHYEYGDDLVLRSENQVINYLDVMKSDK